MECAATILRYIYSMQFMWLLATLIIQPASPFGADVVCENHPSFPMTDVQVELCKKYPQLVSSLFMVAAKAFQRELHHQFQHERWDGKEVNPPIFGSTDKFLTLQTRESAFVYALASAAVVHTVADTCMQGKHLPYCGCNQNLKNTDLPEGEKWAGCSPDVNFTLDFVKEFLDRRVNNETEKHRAFVLHNNRLGRSIVTEYMHKSCICTGSGTKVCSKDKTCRMLLPTMNDIAKILKERYDKSVHSKLHESSGHLHRGIVDREHELKVNSDKMVHFRKSLDYCKANSDLKISGVTGRDCTLHKNKTLSSNHCNNLCCDHGYETYTTQKAKPCNCKFVWCCHVECDTCYETITKHKCR